MWWSAPCWRGRSWASNRAVNTGWDAEHRWLLFAAVAIGYWIGLVAIGVTAGSWLARIAHRRCGWLRSRSSAGGPAQSDVGAALGTDCLESAGVGAVHRRASTDGNRRRVVVCYVVSCSTRDEALPDEPDLRLLQDVVAGTYVLTEPRRPLHSLQRWTTESRSQMRTNLSTTPRDSAASLRVNEPYMTDVRRLLAYLIDLGLLVVAYRWAEDANLPFAHPNSWFFLVIVFAVVNLIVLPSFGLSIGKGLMGVRIVDDRYHAPGLRAALIRSLVPGAVWVALLMASPPVVATGGADRIDVLLGGVIVMLLFIAATDCIAYLAEPQQRTIHDLAAGTYVVQRSSLVYVGVLPRRMIVASNPASWPSLRFVAATVRQTMADVFDSRLPIRRTLGFVFDLALIALCLSVVGWALAGYEHHDVRLMAKAVLLVGYFAGFTAIGATPGTWLAGLRVVSARDGQRPGLTRGLRRMLLFSPYLALIALDSTHMASSMEASERTMLVADLLLLALVLTALVDLVTIAVRGEALHDRVAGTRLVRYLPATGRTADAGRA